MVSSLFVPLGFAEPVTIQGKCLLCMLALGTKDRDKSLPPNQKQEWETRKRSLNSLQDIHIPWIYIPISPATAPHKELHIFSDASTKAVAVLAYLWVYSRYSSVSVGFVMGKAKLAPQKGHTIPRLELCGAVLAVELADMIQRQMDFKLESTTFHTDNKVVLGYIYNQSWRFFVNVSNTMECNRWSSSLEQWKYVPTE